VSGDGDVTVDFKQLKYLNLPSKKRGLTMDLNEGIHSVIRKDGEDKGLQYMLIWIMEKRGRIDKFSFNYSMFSNTAVSLVLIQRCNFLFQEYNRLCLLSGAAKGNNDNPL